MADDEPTSRDDTRTDRTVVLIQIATRTTCQIVAAILLTLVLVRTASAARNLLVVIGLSFLFSLVPDPAVRWLAGTYGLRSGAAVGLIYLAG